MYSKVLEKLKEVKVISNLGVLQQKLKEAKPITWLFYGDSITQGATATFGWRDYTQLFSERIRGELVRVMDMVINSAINGNTTEELLETFDWRVERFEPDVVFLMIGMNDCSDDRPVTSEMFGSNLNKLIEKSKALKALPVLQTACPIIPGSAPEREPSFPTYMDIIRQVARDNKIPLIDHTKHWQANVNDPYLWMANGFHPNQYGHRAFANKIFMEMGIYDPNSPTCKLFIP